MLETHPTIFAEVVPEVRALLVNRFPYVAYFMAIEATIHVIGVIHASRDPMIWQSRVPKTAPK